MKDLVKVQFRKDKGGVFAVFPYIVESDTTVLSYQHVGQHSACNWNVNQYTKAANEAEYKDLLSELKAIGYNVQVIKKRSHKEYLQAYYKR